MPTPSTLAYKSTNPANIYMSNSSSVIEALEEGGAAADPELLDPLDLKNTLLSFELHIGDNQSQKLFLELINPNTQIEQMLFASYAAAIPRAGSPTGAFKGPDGDALLAAALKNRVYYVRWGYTNAGEEGEPPTYALSHMHKVELINLHYSFSAKKERIFKLELVDSYTKQLLSSANNSRPISIQVPVNTMNSWRRASEVVQEVMLHLLTHFEGYVGYSKLSATQIDILDKEFAAMVYTSVAGTSSPFAHISGSSIVDDLDAEVEALAGEAGIQFGPDEQFPTARAFRLTVEEVDRAVMPRSVVNVVTQAKNNIAAGAATRSFQGVKNFYNSLGFTFIQAPGITFSSLTVLPGGTVMANTAGDPVIPMVTPSQNQYGGYLEPPTLYDPGSVEIEHRPWLNAVTEASRVSQDEMTQRVRVVSDRMDMKPRRTNAIFWSSTGSIETSSVKFWEVAHGIPLSPGLSRPKFAYFATKNPYGGYTDSLTRSDMASILAEGKAPIRYTASYDKLAYSSYLSYNFSGNEVLYDLTPADRVAFDTAIQSLEAKEQAWLAETDFDPTAPPDSAVAVSNAAMESYGGALGAAEPAESLADLYPDPDSLNGSTVETKSGEFFEDYADIDKFMGSDPIVDHTKPPTWSPRDNPYMVPPQYRSLVKLNVPAGNLSQFMTLLLTEINDRYFKRGDKYLQFLKIEISDIPESKRGAFEKAMGVNIPTTYWDEKEGFVILTTSDFVRKLYAEIDDGTITSFPHIDLTDPDLDIKNTVTMSIGYDTRTDNILRNLQWTYNLPHMLYGIRDFPVSVSKIINVAKRWAGLDSDPGSWGSPDVAATTPSGTFSTDPIAANQAAIVSVLSLGIQLDRTHKFKTHTSVRSPYKITDASHVRTGTEMTETSLRLNDIAFTDEALKVALGQVAKMSRLDLSGMTFVDAGTGAALTAAKQDELKDNLLEDMKLMSTPEYMDVFFPTLDKEDTAMVRQNYFISGRLHNILTPAFRKINKTPLSVFAQDPGSVDEALAKEVIIAKTEWLNTVAKTVISAKASSLGVPEMDLIGNEIFNRNVFLDVHEPRNPGTRHWLSGVYNIKDIVHKIDAKNGYIQDMTLVRSSNDTAEWIETLNLAKAAKDTA